ncbi:Uncharacterized protein APZ42_028662 [Daphnia magna]|uniref:Uncharacterized protein n=1 Tax=Daphnia magna TaxID=35525 RepID=A0A164Q8C7_9CRUS|nr:Uncharacterized protein APZ42_028662 [Daphnia magna]
MFREIKRKSFPQDGVAVLRDSFAIRGEIEIFKKEIVNFESALMCRQCLISSNIIMPFKFH